MTTGPSKAQIVAALLAQKNKRETRSSGGSGGDTALYRFWDIPEGSHALIRFLPDADSTNSFFWREYKTIKMPFAGVAGGEYPTDRDVTVKVPCAEMFGMVCPITSAIRPWWKTEKEALARQYYRKLSYLFQGFVVSSPFEEKETPENPIRRLMLNKSLYPKIYDHLVDPENEDMPYDFVNGRDFKIIKTRKGDYNNYDSSTWALKTRSLNEEELAAIDQYGLYDLKTFLGTPLTTDQIDAQKAMFEDSIAGRPFDMESYGQWWRPWTGGNDEEGGETRRTPARTAARETQDEEATTTSTPATAAGGPATKNTAAILERIRARGQAA